MRPALASAIASQRQPLQRQRQQRHARAVIGAAADAFAGSQRQLSQTFSDI